MTSLLGFIGPPKILGPPLNLPPLKLGGGGGAATMQVVQEILQNNYQRSILKTQKLEILSPLFEIS